MIRIHRRSDVPRDLRTEMIAEHSAFLTAALAQDRGYPRIPRRRVDQGGFAEVLKLPAARAAVNHFWKRIFDAV